MEKWGRRRGSRALFLVVEEAEKVKREKEMGIPVEFIIYFFLRPLLFSFPGPSPHCFFPLYSSLWPPVCIEKCRISLFLPSLFNPQSYSRLRIGLERQAMRRYTKNIPLWCLL
jgi:hypothetical protein